MLPNRSRFRSSEPANITGRAPSRLTRGISEALAETREISWITTATVSAPPPAPPNSSGYPTAMSSLSTKSLWTSHGNSSSSSISAARGATFSSHSSRTAFRTVSRSSGRAKGSSLTGGLLTSRRPPHDQRVALTAPAAQRRAAQVEAPTPHLVCEGQDEAGTGHPDRMAQRHGPSVHVHDVLVQAQHASGMERDGGEGFVDLDETEVREGGARFLQGPLHGDGRHGVEVGEPLRAHAVSDDLDERLHPKSVGAFAAHHDDRRPTIGDLRGVPRRDRAAFAKRGLQLGERFD